MSVVMVVVVVVVLGVGEACRNVPTQEAESEGGKEVGK